MELIFFEFVVARSFTGDGNLLQPTGSVNVFQRIGLEETMRSSRSPTTVMTANGDVRPEKKRRHLSSNWTYS